MTIAGFKKAWLRQLARAHCNILWRHGLSAPPVSLDLMRGQKLWGRWSAEKRLISISEELILEHPWEAVLGILGHETAHQLATDLAPESRRENAHGPAFQAMTRRIGLDPFYAAASVELKDQCPRPWPDCSPAAPENDKLLEKVRKLLALGNSPVAAEAENAMKAAARLMSRRNLDLLEAEEGRPGAGQYEYRLIKLAARRVDSRLALIAHILGRHFFVECIFVPGYNPLTDKEEKNLELMGRPENTLLAEHVFHFLMERTESLWRGRHREHRGGGLAARNSFIIALLEAFCAKLDEAAKAEGESSSPAPPEGGFSAPILLRDAGLKDYVKSRHPRVTNISGRGRLYDPESDRAGREAGAALNLSRPLESRAEGDHRPLIGY